MPSTQIVDLPINKQITAENIIEKIKEATPKKGCLLYVLITPEMAELILELNTANRPYKRKEIIKMVEDMEADRWEFNGESISLDLNLVLTQGQKRLIAIIESGKAQVFHIQTGLSEFAFATLDTGRVRSGGDVIAMAGYTNANVTAGAIRGWLYYSKQGRVSDRVNSRKVSIQEIDEWRRKTGSMNQMVKCVDMAFIYWKGAKFLSQTSWAWLRFMLLKVTKNASEDVDFFLEKLSTGDGLDSRSKETSAIYILRRKLENFYTDKSATHQFDEKLRYFITAWNHYRNGEIISVLNINKKDPNLPQAI